MTLTYVKFPKSLNPRSRSFRFGWRACKAKTGRARDLLPIGVRVPAGEKPQRQTWKFPRCIESRAHDGRHLMHPRPRVVIRYTCIASAGTLIIRAALRRRAICIPPPEVVGWLSNARSTLLETHRCRPRAARRGSTHADYWIHC